MFRFPLVEPFKNSGWALLDYVDMLKPSKPKGEHVFRPASGVVGNEPQLPVPPSAPIAATPPTSGELDDIEEDGPREPEQALGGAQGASAVTGGLSRTVSASSTTSPLTPAPISQKRPAAAAPTPAPASAKRQRIDALQNITNSVNNVARSMDTNTDKLVAALAPAIPPTPVRAQRASELFREKDLAKLDGSSSPRSGATSSLSLPHSSSRLAHRPTRTLPSTHWVMDRAAPTCASCSALRRRTWPHPTTSRSLFSNPTTNLFTCHYILSTSMRSSSFTLSNSLILLASASNSTLSSSARCASVRVARWR